MIFSAKQTMLSVVLSDLGRNGSSLIADPTLQNHCPSFLCYFTVLQPRTDQWTVCGLEFDDEGQKLYVKFMHNIKCAS